ncbi:MAG: ABC transporter ATP-binding protein [Nitrospinota bacterium]|nr:MAG: ABC transporter ATP-binding protein [Nitrospinota bacterium]
MAKVVLENITKRFGQVLAVDNLNLEIQDREFMTLLGPSGCGKSTTLNMIAGLEEPTAGRIFFDDEEVEHLPPEMRDVSMVFQNYALYPHMTVFKNIAFGLQMRGVPATEIRQRVAVVAKKLGIEDLLDRKPRELSGGQRQRVALGRAIVRDSRVFLLDEPLSNLDAKLRVATRTELKNLHYDLQKTFVYVTHDQEEALIMSDRITILNRGRIQQVGTPEEVYNHPRNEFVAGFIGSPAMNFLPGVLRQEGETLQFHSPAFTYTLPSPLLPSLSRHARRNVKLGIRPKDIRIQVPEEEAIGKAEVLLREPVGSDLYLQMKFSDAILCKVRTDADNPLQRGDVTTFAFNEQRLHFFDASTGDSLLV